MTNTMNDPVPTELITRLSKIEMSIENIERNVIDIKLDLMILSETIDSQFKYLLAAFVAHVILVWGSVIWIDLRIPWITP